MKLAITLLSIILVVLVSLLLHTPVELDVKVCSTDRATGCEQLEVVYGQSLFVYMQTNEQADISIKVGNETMVVPVNGFVKYELSYDIIKDYDMVYVNGVGVYYDVYDTEVTPEYYFVWDSEADQSDGYSFY